MKKLTKKQTKQVAYAMITQTLRCFDGTTFDNYDTGKSCISEEDIENIFKEINKIASKYENEFSHIGNIEDIIKKVKGE